MKLRKFALRGLIILAVVVALCMFFARTVQTITTPKIKLVSATTGRFEDKMKFSGEIYFPETEKFTLTEAQKTNVSVERVYVQPGHWVEEGDTLFTTSVPSYDEDMDKLQEDYSTKNTELMELDIANRRSSQASRQNELYDEMIAAGDELNKRSYEARILAAEGGITLSRDLSGWKKQLSLLKEKDEDLVQAVDKAVAASAAFDDAKTAFFAILEDRKQKVSEDVFKYINDRNALIKELDELTAEMVELAQRSSALQTIVAPRAGWIATMNVEEGETYDGSREAYSMNAADTLPVIRVNLAGQQRTISPDTRADVVTENYGTLRTSVEKTVTASTGEKYLYIALPEEFQEESASALRGLMQNGAEISITYRAKESSTLLPASCVRNDGSDYIFLIQNSWGGFMSSSGMKVIKTPVTVLERSDKTVSIAEDFSWQQVADREDRSLSDGAAVMEYVE